MRISIKKGLDLRLKGGISFPCEPQPVKVNRIAICPDDFEGLIPKCMVKPGDKILAGDALLYHKTDSRIKIVSPVNGVIADVKRGLRRHIDYIIINCVADVEVSRPNTQSPIDLRNYSAENLMSLLAEKGLLVFIRRRPYADIPDISVRPRDIFVTGFDSAPLAYTRTWSENELKALQAGAEMLSRITSGKVYVSRRKGSQQLNIDNIIDVEVKGPHPSGLAGVLAANIRPVNKGETIWTLSVETLWRIGTMVLTGMPDFSTVVAVTGSCVDDPYLATTVIGAQIEPLLHGHLVDNNKNIRIISGNVLTGVKLNPTEDYLRYPYTQITVIPEGDDKDEFMGWASLSLSKMSINPSYPGHFLKKYFSPDARINGGKRAIIMSGEYDRVLPMDILGEFLIKAINARDIEKMEKLGIYEIAPEDFALAECIDSSKQPLQQIIRQGLDFIKKELS